MTPRSIRVSCALFFTAASLLSPLRAQVPVPSPAPAVELAESSSVFQTDTDKWERMTVPVSIDGRGPYRFIVDTGAGRTAIARELAETLQLAAGARAQLHSMTEVSEIQTVIIPVLGLGDRTVRGILAPALERRNLGAEGILGVDSLKAQRVSFDFARQEVTVTPSRRREDIWPADTIVVSARNRFGHLILVDASVEGQKVWVLVDSGSQVTVGNNALRRKLERRGLLDVMRKAVMVSVTGGTTVADETTVKRIRIGGVDIRDMPIAFADVHPFRLLDLMDRPAILLGMEALRLFERVSVDFANRRVRLLAPERASLGNTRLR